MAEPTVGVPIDLNAGSGRAVVWGLASDDLNVNMVSWPEGDGVDEHCNMARDVLVMVTAGTLGVTIDGQRYLIASDHCIVIPKGATRSLVAEGGEVRYVTVHWRRPRMSVDRPSPGG